MTNEPTSPQSSADGLPPSPRPDGGAPLWARPVGAGLTGSLTLALFVVVGFYLYELGIGASDSPVRVIMSVALFLVFAVAGALMTRAWLRGLSWPATPTLVVGALLLPTAWSVIRSGQVVPGLVLAVLAVTGVAVGWSGRAAAD